MLTNSMSGLRLAGFATLEQVCASHDHPGISEHLLPPRPLKSRASCHGIHKADVLRAEAEVVPKVVDKAAQCA